MDKDRIESILARGMDMWATATGLQEHRDPQPKTEFPFAQSYLNTTAVNQHQDKVSQYAKAYGVPEDLAKAVVEVESGGNPGYQGPQTKHGAATGLMGLMPHMFLPGEDPADPDTNLSAGLRALAHYYRQTGDWDQAAAQLAYGGKMAVRDSKGRDGFTYAQQIKKARSAYANPYPMAGQ